MLLTGTAALLTGLLPWPAFQELASRAVPVLAFVVAMSLVTELVDAAGLFRVVAEAFLAALGQGRVFLLWLLVGVSWPPSPPCSCPWIERAVLVAPVVVLLAVHTQIPPLPFALTTIWLANAASLLLPVSNLTNLLAQDRLGLSPAAFAGLVWAPALVGSWSPSGCSYARPCGRAAWPAATGRSRSTGCGARCCCIRHQGDGGAVARARLRRARSASGDGRASRDHLLGLFLWRRRSVLRWSMIPWRPLMLTSGLFMVVEALHANGLTQFLSGFAGAGEGLPALLQLAGGRRSGERGEQPASVPRAGTGGRFASAAAALLIGVNLGPLVTPWASLATLLWHERLRTLNVEIRWGGFAVASLAAVVLAVPLAVVALWLTTGMH